VRQQLLVAAGEPLALRQEDLSIRGHSIEVRINAEDPTQGYLPSTGVLQNLRAPGGPWVRLDTGMYRGMEVGLAYDPMLGKLIVWAPDRAQAIERMIRAIQEMNVGGVRTSLPAALTVLEHERFRSGDYDTHFLESLTIAPPAEWLSITAAAAAIHRHLLAQRRALAPATADRAGWRARGRRMDGALRAHADDRSGSQPGGQA
jgi:acetyl/propionyl-CoA carboxylase alpha subunit